MKWFFNQDHIKKLSHLLADRIDDLVTSLQLDLEKCNDTYFGCCPVHGGDNPHSFNLFCDGYSIRGNWRCFTRHCEKNKDTPPTILGFLKGVLKHKNKSANFYTALEYAVDFLNIKSLHELNKRELKDAGVDRYSRIINRQVKTAKQLLRREDVRQRLIIPPQQFLDRGISREILVRYDIGICKTQGKEMYNRIVVPVYDESNKFLIGCMGRSIHEECPKCHKYHQGECPSYDHKCFNKWINSKGFKTASYLYNYWNAKEEIQKSNTVAVVEGSTDSLKLIQHQIFNNVAAFGDDLSDEQLILLEKTGALNLILLLDNDPAGKKAKQRIRECCGNLYNIIEPEFPEKDICNLNDQEIEQYIVKPIRDFH